MVRTRHEKNNSSSVGNANPAATVFIFSTQRFLIIAGCWNVQHFCASVLQFFRIASVGGFARYENCPIGLDNWLYNATTIRFNSGSFGSIIAVVCCVGRKR